MPSRRTASVGALIVLGLGLGARGGDEPAVPRAPVPASTPLRCDIGERPPYFVPGNRRLALLGCARLGVSGKRVDFSAAVARMDGELQLCINAAYSGRGRRGFFIPSRCGFDPPVSRLAIRAAGSPRQGVRAYERVVWGTAGPAASEVTACFRGGRARAAVLPVPRRLARRFGERAFGLFVVEVPLWAAGPVTVQITRRAPASHLANRPEGVRGPSGTGRAPTC